MDYPAVTIGIAGPTASGKGTARKILEIILGSDFCVLSSGMLIRFLAHREKYIDPDSTTTQQRLYSEKKKTGGNAWLHAHFLTAWAESNKKIGGFDGVRMPWDVEFIKRAPRWILFYIHTEDRERHQRAVERALRGDPEAKSDDAHISFEQFLNREEHETAVFVKKIRHIRGVTVIANKNPQALGQSIILALLNRRIITPATIDENVRQKLESLYAAILKSR